MRRLALTLGLTFVVGIAGGVIADQVLTAQQAPVKRTELLKSDMPGIEGKEGIIFIAEIAPGAFAAKHYHPGHEFVYVLEGSGILAVEGKPPLSVKAGDTFYQPPKQVHEFKNASKTAPVKNLVFLMAEKGQPLTVPVK